MCETCNAALDLTRFADVDRSQFHSQGGCHSLSGAKQTKPGRDPGIAQYSGSRKMRSDLFEQLQPFSTHAVLVDCKTRRIGAWLCQAGHKASTNRVDDTNEDDWDRASRFQQRSHGRGTIREYDLGLQFD